MMGSKSLDTGVPLMDNQHQELFRHIDDLGDRSKVAMSSNTLYLLDKCLKKHFREEELLLASSGYPDRLNHRKQHKDFAAEYDKLQDEYHRNPTKQGAMSLRISRAAGDWLQQHILGPDIMFAKFYHEKQGGVDHTQDCPAAVGGSLVPCLAPELFAAYGPAGFDGSLSQTQGEKINHLSDEEVLKRVSSQALADELVRRSKGCVAGLFGTRR